jgi:CO/xanthine dehydrogenase Mo-binding subunit
MAMTDIGTWTCTIAQITAEMLGLPIDRIRVDLGDSNFPEAAGSGGSWGAGSAGLQPTEEQRDRRARDLRRRRIARQCDLQRLRRAGPGVSDHLGQAAFVLADPNLIRPATSCNEPRYSPRSAPSVAAWKRKP